MASLYLLVLILHILHLLHHSYIFNTSWICNQTSCEWNFDPQSYTNNHWLMMLSYSGFRGDILWVSIGFYFVFYCFFLFVFPYNEDVNLLRFTEIMKRAVIKLYKIYICIIINMDYYKIHILDTPYYWKMITLKNYFSPSCYHPSPVNLRFKKYYLKYSYCCVCVYIHVQPSLFYAPKTWWNGNEIVTFHWEMLKCNN